MNMPAESSPFAFPKLDGSNYTSWKEDMKVVLMDRGCWSFIIEDKPCPEQATEKEKFEYDWRKQRCYTIIYQGIERKFLPLIRYTTDGKEAWNILKTNFEPTSKARLAVLIDEFFELKFNPVEETIGIFCKRVDEKKTQIEEFNHLEVEKQLVNEAGRIQLKQKDLNLDYTEDAYTVGSFRLQETSKKSSERSGAVLDPSRNPGQYRKIHYPKGMGPSCEFCSRKGHDASKCYKKQNKEKKQAFASETSFCGTNQASGVSTDCNLFLIDTAATSHFCYERDWFKNFKELKTTKALLADKKSTCEVEGIGDIDFIVQDFKGNVKITLKDVLYTPNMRRNLISGARMDIAGLKIIWSNNVMRICHSNNEYFFSAFRRDMFYIVSGYPLLDSVMYTSVDLNLIHKRLCHVNIPLIKDMCKNKSVKGLEKVNIKIDNESCIACNVGKATRTSLKKNYAYKRVTKSVLDKVHMDLWGPAPVNSLGGSKYFLSIIDDFSRKIDVFTLKSKSEVFSIFKEYLSRVQRELGRKLKSVRTDNGLEFCHKDFETFLRNLGIKIERTSFYTPELSGIAERFNRSSMEAVRTMLQDSGLQPRFWAEALHAYVHTKNRCSHKLTEGKTPMEIWSGHKPSIRHCRTFGSLAYVYVPTVNRNKLQPKAKIGILVGYAVNRRGYRRNKLAFDPNQFNFKPTKTNTRFEEKSECHNETSSDSVDEASFVNDIFQHEIYMTEIPKTFKETQISPDKEKWDKAMSEEIKLMQNRKVWDLVEPKSNMKILGCRWVYNIKHDEKNNVKKYKSRLVAQGFKQRPGVDFTDVFAPLVNFDIIKFLFVLLVCILGWNHCQIDVKGAYLYGNLDIPIYMQQPEGFAVKGCEHYVCRLHINEILFGLGFHQNELYNDLYTKSNCILLVYVDDIVVFSKSQSDLENSILNIKIKLEITELGPVRYLLGVNFERIGNSVYLHQNTYINKLKTRFKNLPRRRITLPLKVGCILPDRVKENEIIETELMRQIPYKTLIGCSSFIANRSRPDIAFAVNTMSQFCNGYTYHHWTIVVDILNYVFNTMYYKINLSDTRNTRLTMYSDSSWGCKLNDRHSTSGYIMLFGNVPITWKSQKQKCIALSSMEAEFIALTESVKCIIWYSKILKELNLIDFRMPELYCDSQSAIHFSKNNIENSKTKHIEVKYKFVRKLLYDKEFELNYINSKENLADFLTKPLVKEKFLSVIKVIFQKYSVTDGAECWNSNELVQSLNESISLVNFHDVAEVTALV
ncbi:Retrovirus-related Pol polyprotein from transposon TNT 1-94 [Araneus ventricosus]|uniref:Retrovirus-related Pol polyprotein from transposon TNT 1-94 n=1 Tax=Araneus ventricosus TaxID=182803 RepID=A0A4Y2E060_ARAVE|nr:Retrovirus-related Pol polyprotein from transposon TNT 1-94 [Araneus ventricosus]GBM21408.1 Retrovirus-related Pol polyprotein from transposon TNT 1-94 [Araneus ventricosus]